MSCQSFWCCAQTQPNQEQRALKNLRRQGFDAFYPFYLQVTKAQKRTLVKPVFASYVFVKLADDLNWSPINNTYGVSRLLTYGNGDEEKPRIPQRVPDGFIASLSRYLRSSNSVIGPMFSENTRVRVRNGVLRNHEAIVRWSSEERVGLLFAIMNREVEIEMAVDDVEIMQAS